MCKWWSSMCNGSVPRHQLQLLFVALAALASTCHSLQTAGTIITSVSFLFEAFSPYSMIRFFEFSDKGWNISEPCLKDMYSYLEGLRHGTLWAVKLYDATGYYGGGGFGASNVRIQSPNLCRTLLQQHEQFEWQMSRKSWTNATVIPFPVHIIMGHYQLELAHGDSYKMEQIQQLICFPQSCTNADLQLILEVYLFQGNDAVRNCSYLRHRIVSDTYSAFQDIDFFILMTFLCVSLCLHALTHFLKAHMPLLSCASKQQAEEKLDAAAYKSPLSININKLIRENSPLENMKKACLDVDTNVSKEGNQPHIVAKRRSHKLEDMLAASSLSNTLYNLFQDDAMPQNGVFAAFTVLWIYVHLTAEVQHLASNLGHTAEATQNILLKHASYVIDSYFFVSASKLAYQFWQTFPRDKLNVCEQLLHIFRLIMQKFLSLQPSYTFCLFAEHLLDKHLYNNVALEIPSSDYNNCRNNKVKNILYLDTFFPLGERCMPWTWFLSLEVQFFIVACLVLLLAEIRPRYAIIIGIAIFCTSIFAASLWELNRHSQLKHSSLREHELRQFNLVFDNICLRVAPYLLGLCLGRILHKSNANIDCWLACILIVCCSSFGYELLFAHVNQFVHAFLTTLSHAMWSLILLWIVLTSMTQYGAHLYSLLCFKYSHTVEQLSPICLIIAPIVIRLFVFTADAPIYSSQGQIFVMALGCLLITYVGALLLHVLLDGPLCAVMEVVLTHRQ